MEGFMRRGENKKKKKGGAWYYLEKKPWKKRSLGV
jgi:hypothetical protein